MKTAVLISGQMRTFESCIANLNWTVFRKLENPTFFVSCADDEQASSAYLLEGYFDRVHIEIVKQPTTFEYYPIFALAAHAPYTPTPNNPAVIPSILRQLWHYKRVWQFMCERPPAAGPGDGDRYAIVGAGQFDRFVRCRPDLHFHRLDLPDDISTEEFYGPWKATCGGVNDRFSIMGLEAATAYFTAFDRLEKFLDAGCPLHPESIQQYALESMGCRIRNTLQAEFTALRMTGAGSHVPLVEYPGELARYLEAIRQDREPTSFYASKVT